MEEKQVVEQSPPPPQEVSPAVFLVNSHLL